MLQRAFPEVVQVHFDYLYRNKALGTQCYMLAGQVSMYPIVIYIKVYA